MARYGRPPTDAQWGKIQPLLPKRRQHPAGGRPPKDSAATATPESGTDVRVARQASPADRSL